MAKGKVYGFNPWVDQVDSISQIMKQSGERTESALLRKLVDEALEARRNKGSSVHLTQEPDNELDGRIEAIEDLLVRLVREADVSLRIQDVCLALLQDALAEAHATHRLAWRSLVIPELREQGVDAKEFEHRFALQTEQAKAYAYGLALRIKESQEPRK